MSNNKYYGIRFPFTAKDDERFFIDMENNAYQEIKSDLIHLLFTPIGQRVRNPSFGSKLIRFVFEQNDQKTYSDIKIEIQQCISRYFPGLTITELSVDEDKETSKSAIIKVNYEIDEGDYKTFDSFTISI